MFSNDDDKKFQRLVDSVRRMMSGEKTNLTENGGWNPKSPQWEPGGPLPPNPFWHDWGPDEWALYKQWLWAVAQYYGCLAGGGSPADCQHHLDEADDLACQLWPDRCAEEEEEDEDEPTPEPPTKATKPVRAIIPSQERGIS